MALQPIIVSFSVIDASGDRATMPIYGLFDDATATLTSITAWAAARAAQLDAVLDGQIVAESINILPSLPGGLKTSPNANSNIELAALFTFGLAAPATSHSQGLMVPAFLPSKFTADVVNTSDAAVTAFVNALLPPAGTVIATNEDFGTGFISLRRAVKTFRKLGKR